MLGLTAAAVLADAGASHVVVADVSDERLQNSKHFGASECVNTTDPGAIGASIAAVTANRGFDIVLEFAGVLPAVETAIASVRTGGCVLLAGSVFPTEALSFSPEMIVRRMLTVRGLHNYQPDDLAEALRFLERTQSRFPFASLVSQTFSLDKVQDAFEFARDQHPVRVAIRS